MNKRDCLLIDKTNWHILKDMLVAEMRAAELVGIDIETEDSHRHEGLNRAMKVDDEGYKSSGKKLLFDTQRTIVTGFSWAIKSKLTSTTGGGRAYYLNLAHADVQNRLHFHDDKVYELLDAKNPEAWWVAHKAPYELTFLKNGNGPDLSYKLNYDLGEKIICTLQLAVTAFNEDSYPMDEFLAPGLGNIKRLFPEVLREFSIYEPGLPMTKEQEELVYKVTAKESDAEHSYNGYVNSIKYGYSLKRLAKKFLGYEQVTFEEVMSGNAHMGQLTGAQVASYGCDDAWVCLELYAALMAFLMEQNPEVIATFFAQENPMCQVYSDVWSQGVRINQEAVLAAREMERAKVAQTLRTMKAAVKAMLPFPDDVHEKLMKYDAKLYGKGAAKYRRQVTEWAMSPDTGDAFKDVYAVRTSISKQWAEQLGMGESAGLSLNYYQVVRCILLDLCRCSFQIYEGKIQSDAEAVKKMRERLVSKAEKEGIAHWNVEDKKYLSGPVHDVLEDFIAREPDDFVRFKATLDIIDHYKRLKDSDQAIKLYINSYLNMTDAETGRVYPILSSMLNSRRMALESPNLSQLAKSSDMAYVRGFFLPDEEDHVIVSADWSGIELLEIGDFSGDPEFAKVYGQLPHGDLHTATAADLLGMSVEDFKALPDFKRKRTDVGKGASFGYFYSGALGTVAREIGLTSDEMWEYTERYRQRFAVAEAWRVGIIGSAAVDGFVQLPDKHKRYRFESTGLWAQHMRNKFKMFGSESIEHFGAECIKKIQRRSGNQSVNSYVQGTCATLAKRTVLRMRQTILEKGYRARFMFPVHDELCYSVHRADAVAFMRDLWTAMCTHPDLIKTLKLDAAMAVGLNYWAFDKDKNPKGQIELDEASAVSCLPEERWKQKLTDVERERVVEYLFQ